jgi:hypothetical protein
VYNWTFSALSAHEALRSLNETHCKTSRTTLILFTCFVGGLDGFESLDFTASFGGGGASAWGFDFLRVKNDDHLGLAGLLLLMLFTLRSNLSPHHRIEARNEVLIKLFHPKYHPNDIVMLWENIVAVLCVCAKCHP